MYIHRWFLVHSQILLSGFVEAWVRKYSFYLTDMLGEHLTHLSAFDTKMINCMALGLQSQNSDRNQLGPYYFLADWPGATPDPLRNPSPHFISFPEVGTYPAEWFKREQLGLLWWFLC